MSIVNKNRARLTDVTVYTDGSCDPVRQAGGWASVIFMHGEKIVLQGEATTTSHQRMELEAVIQTFQWLEAKEISIGSITVYSDSQYVVGLKERKEKIKKSCFLTAKRIPMRNNDLLISLLGYLDRWDVALIKIKAHQKSGDGQDHNREVDKLCRKIVRRQIVQQRE